VLTTGASSLAKLGIAFKPGDELTVTFLAAADATVRWGF